MKPTSKSNNDIVEKKVKQTAMINNAVNHKKGKDEGFIDSSEEGGNTYLPDDLPDGGNDMKPNDKSYSEIVWMKM